MIKHIVCANTEILPENHLGSIFEQEIRLPRVPNIGLELYFGLEGPIGTITGIISVLGRTYLCMQFHRVYYYRS